MRAVLVRSKPVSSHTPRFGTAPQNFGGSGKKMRAVLARSKSIASNTPRLGTAPQNFGGSGKQ
jgi:hypothetical protein